jgi:hypothetical protein
MEIARQAKGGLSDTRDVYQLFASGCYPNGRPFRVPPLYEHDFSLWQRYQERQAVKIGLYGFWREITRYLEEHSREVVPVAAIMRRVWAGIENSAIARLWLGQRPLERSIESVQRRIRAKLARTENPSDPPDFDLCERVIDDGPDADQERLGTSLALLFVGMAIWEMRKKDSSLTHTARRAHSEGGRQRIALNTLIDDTRLRADELVRDYVAWLVSSCVLAQAVHVATDKLQRGDFRYFIIPDEGGYRSIRDQNPRSYLAYDGRRVLSGYRLLEGLDLINLDHEPVLTPTGTQLLDTLRDHHRSVRPKAAV